MPQNARKFGLKWTSKEEETGWLPGGLAGQLDSLGLASKVRDDK